MSHLDFLRHTFNVTERTIRNWQRFGYPNHVRERLSLRDGTHEQWQGFKILDGTIVTPAGDTIQKGEIELMPWTHEQLMASLSATSVLERRLTAVEKLSVPSNAPSFSDFLTLAAN